MKKFELLKDHNRVKTGTIVYSFTGHDYGLVREDNYITGIPHYAVTQNKSGDYPFFTCPIEFLKVIDE